MKLSLKNEVISWAFFYSLTKGLILMSSGYSCWLTSLPKIKNHSTGLAKSKVIACKLHLLFDKIDWINEGSKETTDLFYRILLLLSTIECNAREG